MGDPAREDGAADTVGGGVHPGMLDTTATGEVYDRGPSASFRLWAVVDGPALIREYLDWLDRCGSYSVVASDLSGRGTHRRTVTTEVDRGGGALTLTRSFVPAAGGGQARTDHVGYYPVRGLLLVSSTTVGGDTADLVRRQAAQTVRQLQAL